MEYITDLEIRERLFWDYVGIDCWVFVDSDTGVLNNQGKRQVARGFFVWNHKKRCHDTFRFAGQGWNIHDMQEFAQSCTKVYY